MENIESTGRVELRWPVAGPAAVPGSPDGFPQPDLMVVWYAGPPDVTRTARTADIVNYLDSHAYDGDPQSGAGNCRCGGAREHVRHPHDFTPRANDTHLCVCGRPRHSRPHHVSPEADPS